MSDLKQPRNKSPDVSKTAPLTPTESAMLDVLEAEEANQILPGSHETKRPRSQLPGWTTDDIQTALRRYNRTPFQDLLGEWIGSAPTGASIASWARKHPDRYASALSHLGRLAGYSERREVLTGSITPASMSDSQLEDTFLSLAAALGVEGHTLLEAVGNIMKSPKSLSSHKEAEGAIIEAEVVPEK